MSDEIDGGEHLTLVQRLKEEALRLGFDAVGIAPAVTPPGYGQYTEWLAKGHSAGMEYLKHNAEVREHPERLLVGVRSVIVVSLVYGEPEPAPTSEQEGRIARYARGADYHEVLWTKLEELLNWLRQHAPGVQGRAVADTAPLLERDFARLAGLGWIAKNTMLINKKLGSFTFLGALLVDLELPPDRPHHANHCGTCTRCLEACPTDAFAGPYELDAGRCISYWTIEHKGLISDEFSKQLHGWAFGCDICQDVCPWNRKAPRGRLDSFKGRQEWTNPDLIDWLTREASAWSELLRGTALKRTKRVGLVRNALLILGTRRVHAAVQAIGDRLADRSEDKVVRASAAWALGRIGSDICQSILEVYRDDSDSVVADAVKQALKNRDVEKRSQTEGLDPSV